MFSHLSTPTSTTTTYTAHKSVSSSFKRKPSSQLPLYLSTEPTRKQQPLTWACVLSDWWNGSNPRNNLLVNSISELTMKKFDFFSPLSMVWLISVIRCTRRGQGRYHARNCQAEHSATVSKRAPCLRATHAQFVDLSYL